ncbi:MAG: hypothetical protein WAM14_22435 [Candidatus Nitrosopolaris sp.]
MISLPATGDEGDSFDWSYIHPYMAIPLYFAQEFFQKVAGHNRWQEFAMVNAGNIGQVVKDHLAI